MPSAVHLIGWLFVVIVFSCTAGISSSFDVRHRMSFVEAATEGNSNGLFLDYTVLRGYNDIHNSLVNFETRMYMRFSLYLQSESDGNGEELRIIFGDKSWVILVNAKAGEWVYHYIILPVSYIHEQDFVVSFNPSAIPIC